MEDAGQEVAAELIGTERMTRRARRPQALGEIGQRWIVGSEPRRGQGGDHDGERQADAEPATDHVTRTRGSSQP